jgi:hypothetical protein
VSGLNKMEIARRHLGTALALFLDDLDPVAVQTLACSGSEIAEHLSKVAGEEPFSKLVMEEFPDLDKKKLQGLRNKYWNAFKHATTHQGVERDDSVIFSQFSDEKNDHTLFLGWYDYMMATSSFPIAASVFQIWYFAKYPAADLTAEAVHLFGDLRNVSRGDAKARMREVIRRFSEDPEIVQDSRTDRRPLMMGALD